MRDGGGKKTKKGFFVHWRWCAKDNCEWQTLANFGKHCIVLALQKQEEANISVSITKRSRSAASCTAGHGERKSQYGRRIRGHSTSITPYEYNSKRRRVRQLEESRDTRGCPNGLQGNQHMAQGRHAGRMLQIQKHKKTAESRHRWRSLSSRRPGSHSLQ